MEELRMKVRAVEKQLAELQVKISSAQTPRQELAPKKSTTTSTPTTEAAKEKLPDEPVEPPAVPLRGVQRRCRADKEMGLLHDRGCRVSESKRCTKSYTEALAGDSRCPQDDWANDMVLADPEPDKVIVNVGCNKGHDSIIWLQRFDQTAYWNLTSWSLVVKRYGNPAPGRPKSSSQALKGGER